MTISAIQDFSTTAGSNTDISGVSIAEGCPPSNVNDALRALCAQIKAGVANQGSNIASSGSIDLGAATGQYVKITGTTSITALGTAAAGTTRDCVMTSGFTLTYNATSLITPTAASITGAAGDCFRATSEGSGNWRVTNYLRATGLPIIKPTEAIIIACSDETTALTSGTGKVSFRMPYAMTLTAVPRAMLVTAQSSGNIFTVDINEGGSSILSTKITIDNTEKTSTSAVTPPVLSDTSIADDALMTVDIDQIGAGDAAGLKVTLIGRQT